MKVLFHEQTRLTMEGHLPDGAALLHHLGPVEPRQLAESVIAVDDGPLHDLSVPYEEAGLWGTGDRRAQPPDHNPDPPLGSVTAATRPRRRFKPGTLWVYSLEDRYFRFLFGLPPVCGRSSRQRAAAA